MQPRPRDPSPRAARAAAVGLLLLAALPPPAAGQPAETGPLPRPLPALTASDPRAEADLFAMPAITEATRAAAELAQAGDPAAAAGLLDAVIADHPGLGAVRAMRAGVAMLADDPATALAELAAAAEHGADPGPLAADPLFAPLRADPRFRELAARPAPPPPPAPVPAPVANGRAPVSAANTGWDPATERLVARFAVPAATDAAVLPARPKTAARDILAEHWKRGRAAGNRGDLYDNRDRGHSTLKPGAHPQLAHVAYAPAARAADLDYGLNDRLLFDAPTLGNSSTAITAGALWRSLPRAALTAADGTGPLRLWQNASRNQLYVYPAHRDWTSGRGDLYPANTPYLLISHGSSGSDQPLLEAVAMILAAFRPATKQRLVAENLVVPTVQMVFRRSLRSVTSREDYLGGPGNPAVFEGVDVNLARMVSLANSIAPDAIPPQVRIRVLEEDLGTEGIDFFGQGLSEQLFDTPAAVARVWRSKAGRRSILVTAADTADPNGRALRFEWRLLQGDPAKVAIEPLGDGATARITLDWHDPFPISEDTPIPTARVDVGVFAGNGAHDSAPAMLSWYCPPTEARSYAAGPDGGPPRLVAIDHADPARAAAYADPMLVPRADWRDTYRTDAGGTVTGWTRSRAGRDPEEFTAAGDRILGRDAAGNPDRVTGVAHVLGRDPAGRLVVEEHSSDAPPGGPVAPPD